MRIKKWPILAQIIIALGLLISLHSVIMGILAISNVARILNILYGFAGLAIFWSVYKFEHWALTGLNILLSVKISSVIILVFMGLKLSAAIFAIIITALIVFYFNSSEIKKLFLKNGG